MQIFMNAFPVGILAALAAAALFGAGTPVAKLLLAHTGPWLLAALLYFGSGCGLALLRLLRGTPRPRLAAREGYWLAGAVLAGGVVAPVLLMGGLSAMPAADASLLLNAEAVFTALLAWFAFKENFDGRVVWGMAAIVAGAVALSWPQGEGIDLSTLWPALAVLSACLAWGLDNNLTRKVALQDASWIAMVKGLGAGGTNLLLALATGATWPGVATVGAAALLGFLSYGSSLWLFVLALRHLGTARTGAYFSVAPFFGAVLALLWLRESLTANLALGGALMAVGVGLHLSERHVHEHRHEAMEHTHSHAHGTGDPHHDHTHDEPVVPGTRHSHLHRHVELTHRHAHYPDAHHRHEH